MVVTQKHNCQMRNRDHPGILQHRQHRVLRQLERLQLIPILDPDTLPDLQANLQDVLDLQPNLQDLQDLQHDLQLNLQWQWQSRWRNRWGNILSGLYDSYQVSNTTRTEIMERKQMRQDRYVHNNTLIQVRDPDLHTDLQPNLQEDPPTDLQMDLQGDLQVRTDLQPDLWVQTGLGATLQPSPLVLFQFPFQAETLTGRERYVSWGRYNPLPGSRRLSQGPKHVIGELSIKAGHAYRNLQESTRIYKTHHITNTSQELTKGQQALESEQRKSLQQFPGNAPTPGASSPANGQSSCTFITWKGNNFC